MTKRPDFDPIRVADALAVLESELRDELKGEHAAQALVLLRFELARVATEARAWAERQDLPVQLIPGLPPAGASIEEHVAYLRHLAGELRQLAGHPKKSRNQPSSVPDQEKTMREVFARLRRNRAEALLEFQEFEHALSEVLRHLEGLEGTLRDLHAGASALATKERAAGGVAEAVALEQRAERASTTCEQILVSFRQIRGGVHAWEVTES